jgi:hypothetical protein
MTPLFGTDKRTRGNFSATCVGHRPMIPPVIYTGFLEGL